MKTTHITKDFEKLNLEIFQNNERGDYEEQIESGINIHIYKAGNEINYVESHPNSYFSFCKVYYLNGNIKEKGLVINHSLCMVGIWYYFDESGKCFKEEDLDKEYHFSFENVVEYCKREKIPIEKGLTYPEDIYFPTNISRYDSANKSFWIIDYFKREGFLTVTVTLDSKTGKILSQKSTPITW